jgi:hypothetical protein
MCPADDRTGIIKKADVILQKRTFKAPGPMAYLAANKIRPGFRGLEESIKEREPFNPEQGKMPAAAITPFPAGYMVTIEIADSCRMAIQALDQFPIIFQYTFAGQENLSTSNQVRGKRALSGQFIWSWFPLECRN